MFDALTIDRRKLEADKNRALRAILRAGTLSIHDQTKGLEDDLEKITRMAVRGKLWRAWKSHAFPRDKGPAREPAGEVFINGGSRSKGAMKFFTQEGRITAGGGGYLAIPTDAAGPRGRKNDLTPGEWERRNGTKLRFIYRRSGASLLVMDGGRLAGKKQIGKLASARAQSKGQVSTIVIFVLVPFVAFGPRFAIAPVVQRREGMLASDFERRASALPDVK